ncbi:hypothetical protein [Rhodovarius sp.]|jgi:hypothetical protein|uniref:hypothetical protein n=1 Tax=Rhodovarius sp. TaxID=2972673 RepID=UPI003341A366
MRILLLLALLAMPAAAQPRGVAVHDGSWVGMRTLQCRVGGRLQRERVTMTIRNGEVTVPGLLGDPELVGTVDAQGEVRLPRFNTFGPGEGTVRGDHFEGEHMNRSRNCLINYDLRREAAAPRRR